MVKLSKDAPDKVQSAIDSGYMITSDDEALTGGLAIYGPRRVGKSHTACTASEFYPEVLGESWVDLEDLAVLPYDAGATAFMPGWKLRCPYVYDINRAIADTKDPLSSSLKAIDTLAKTPATWLIIDTVSMLDKYLSDWASIKAGDDKGYDIYRHMLNAHKRIYVAANETGKRCIFLCHSKALMEVTPGAKGAEQATKNRKAAYAVAPDIVPDITGQSATVYLANCNAQLVVQIKVDPATKAKKRYIFVGNVAGFEGGSRWEAVFGSTEAIEPNIRKMLAQVMGK